MSPARGQATPAKCPPVLHDLPAWRKGQQVKQDPQTVENRAKPQKGTASSEKAAASHPLDAFSHQPQNHQQGTQLQQLGWAPPAHRLPEIFSSLSGGHPDQEPPQEASTQPLKPEIKKTLSAFTSCNQLLELHGPKYATDTERQPPALRHTKSKPSPCQTHSVNSESQRTEHQQHATKQKLKGALFSSCL